MILNKLKTSGKLSGISDRKAALLRVKENLTKDEQTWLKNYNKSKKK